MRLARNLLLLAGAGFLSSLAFPRAGWWPLVLVGLAPLLHLVRSESALPPALAGFAWGSGYFGGLLSWLYRFFRHYGGLNVPLSAATLAILVAYLAIYPGVFAYLARRLGSVLPGAGPLVLPAAWVGLEWIRGWFLSGFPWGLVGYALAPIPPLVQVATLTGVYGVSFLALSANVAAAAWMAEGGGSRGMAWRSTALAAALFAAAILYGVAGRPVPAAEGSGLRVGLVQAAVPQDRKWDPEAAMEILQRHENLTREAAADGARLVLWPESSSPFPLAHPRSINGTMQAVPDRPYRDRLEALARSAAVDLLVGTVDYRRHGEEVRPLNAAALVRPDGSWGETYAKIHLVPFGEYVPLGPVLGFVNRLAQGAIGDFLPGTSTLVVRAGGARVGTAICYEMIFPALVRKFTAGGAELLANLTNDAWFGDSAGPYQHLQMAAFRAIENRRFLIRAANTGISAIVDPTGRVVARLDLDRSGVLIGEVAPRRERTFYARHGDVFAILCAILAAAAAIVAARPGRGATQEGATPS